MSTERHHAVQTLHERAATALSHTGTASGGFWRSWFGKPTKRQFADDVRAFVVALDYLLDVPPTMLTRSDLTSVGEDIERVVERVEIQIESSPDDAASLAPTIYVIRTRYEQLYTRGALKAD